MLQAFRTHKRWLMFIAMVLIIPSFVVTGIYSYSRMSTDDNAIARVGEVPILPEQFDMAQRQQLQNLQQQLGEAFRPNMLDNAEARAAILQSMMDDSAVAQTVAKEWVTVSEAEAIALVKNADALKENGQFSPELYENFLRSQGKSDEQFVYELRQDLAKNTLISGVSATHPAPKALAQDLHDILAEERQVRTMIFNVGDYYDEAKASDEEVAAYYKSHENDFYSPEHLKIEYVVLSPEDFKKDIKPNEEEVKVFYEQNQNRWSVPEERRASHILIEFGDDKAAALKKAEALLAEAKADPSKFGELAKANSVDTGSANDGGDLSYFGRGVMVKPFEDAVFAAKKGDIVGPVESEFGYHIIYVTDVRDQHVKKFEEVRGEIEREYVEQMAIRAFSEAADEFTNMVYEQSDTLAPVAEKFGIKIETAENVTREGVEDPALKRVINERVVEHLFGEEALSEKRNTSAVEVASNTLVSARVVEHFPTALQPLDAVKVRIVEAIKTEKAAAMAKAEGEKKLAEVLKSKSLEGFSEPVWVSRQNPKGQPEVLVNREIAIPSQQLPTFTGTAVPGGAYIVGYVAERRLNQAKPEEVEALRREIAAIYGEADRRAYLSALKAVMKSEILRPDFIEGKKDQEP